MADPRFFTRSAPKRLADIAALCGGRLADPAAADVLVEDVAPLDQAEGAHISFLDNPRYRDSFTSSQAGACIVAPKLAEGAPAGCRLILSESPYKSYALTAQAFYPDPPPPARIAGSAAIGDDVVIGDGCVIEDGVVIGARAVIGAGTWIAPNAVIGAGVVIGARCRIGAGASVFYALIGENTRLYAGARIGQDGFGFAIDPAGHVRVPQLGRVRIGNNVEIGANSCIDRGAGPDTVIGDGTWIDNLVMIGHNVQIGRGCVLVGQCGVAGSTVIEDYAVLAAQSGVAGHLRIGRGARIGAQTGVLRNIPAGEEHFGIPSQPVKQAMRQIVALKQLTKTKKGE